MRKAFIIALLLTISASTKPAAPARSTQRATYYYTDPEALSLVCKVNMALFGAGATSPVKHINVYFENTGGQRVVVSVYENYQVGVVEDVMGKGGYTLVYSETLLYSEDTSASECAP